ncbi:MAG: DEAD/DEAH box helicase, partial [Actinomycetes bacterium]
AELASAVSALVYEARRSEDSGPPRVPGGRVRAALEETLRLWGQLDRLEDDNHLDFLHEPDLGFAWAAWRWASGAELDDVLRETDLPAGDFVRWVKQVVDLLGQIADAADEESGVRRTAQRAIDGLRRGVVAYSSVG